MKIKSLLAIAIILTGSMVFAQQKKTPAKNIQPKTQSKASPQIQKPVEPALKGTIFFENTAYNMSEVDEDLGRKQVNFNFTNIGKGGLQILNIETGCGCTSAEWDKDKVYVQGEKGHIVITFNPKNLEGQFSRTITVLTDGDPKLSYLSVEGSVTGPTRQLNLEYPYTFGGMRFSKNVLSMVHVLDDRHDSILLKIYNSTNKRVQIQGLRTPPFITGKIYSPYLEPKGYAQITFVIMPEILKKYGPIEDQVVIVTSEKEMPVKTMVFKADIIENFSTLPPEQKKNPPKIMFTQPVKDLGDVYYGEVVDYDFEVTNKGKSELILRRAYGSCGCTVGNVSTEPIKKGKKGKVSIRFNAKNLYGEQVKTITVISNDPNNTFTTLTIKAKLVEPGAKK